MNNSLAELHFGTAAGDFEPVATLDGIQFVGDVIVDSVSPFKSTEAIKVQAFYDPAGISLTQIYSDAHRDWVLSVSIGDRQLTPDEITEFLKEQEQPV